MKKLLVAALMMYTILMLSGCGDGGGGSSPPPVVVTQVVTSILSTLAYDGDILNGTTVSLSAPSVLAGRDPFSFLASEYRAFLVFPLTGLGGVPGSAFIDAATLDIFIDNIRSVNGSIPIRIELVSYSPPSLQPLDYYRINLPPLASMTTTIFSTDYLNHVRVDVTALMAEAQRLKLPDFQIRILEDDTFVFPDGLIEINDTTINRAPLLTVTYH